MEEDIKARDNEIARLIRTVRKRDEVSIEFEETALSKVNENVKLLETIVDLKQRVADKVNHEKHKSHESILKCKDCDKSSQMSPPDENHIDNSHVTQRKIMPFRIRCLLNDKGHCRYGRFCTFEHVTKICENKLNCKIQMCLNRHPKPCKFDQQCRFGPNCSFDHTATSRLEEAKLLENDDVEGNNVNDEVEENNVNEEAVENY